MKKKIRLAIKYTVMYASMLVPKNKNLCVFGAWLGEKFSDNTKALFLEAQKREKLRCVWITKDASVVEEVRALGYEAYHWTSMQGIFIQLRAKYAFVTNGISDLKHAFLGRAIFINLWHGIPLKKIGYDDFYECDWNRPVRKFRDKVIGVPLGKEYVVATSDTIANIYESAFRRPKEYIVCLGQPRNDVLCRPYTKQIFKDKKIILYAPTHRKEGNEPILLSELFPLEQLQQLCEDWDVYFVVKKHFYHKNEIEALEKYNRILDITAEQIDTQQLLLESDILITDYSSIYIDYMLLERPILFYNYDYEHYLMNDRQMYFSYDQVTPGEKVQTGTQVIQALTELFNGKTYDEKKKEEIYNLFYCTDGRKPVSNALLDKLENGFFR